MKQRLIFGLALIGVVAAAALAPTAYSKDDKEKEKEEREALVEKYETKKGGKLFTHLPLYVDKEKLKETRWDFKTPEAGNDTQKLELKALFPSSKADAPPRIEALFWSYKHKTQQGSSSSIHNYRFDEANMEKVLASDYENMLKAMYLTFMNTAKDKIEKECKEPKKKKVGPAKIFAQAVATDAKTSQRVRKEWYSWTEPNWSIVVEVTYSTAVYDKDEWLDKVETLMKNIKDAK